MLDNFFKKNDIEIKLEVLSNYNLQETEECKLIQPNKYEISFFHSKKDGIQLIMDSFYLEPNNIKNSCISFDFLWKNMFHHYYTIQKNPFLKYKTEDFIYDSFSNKFSIIPIEKNKVVFFSSILCFLYYKLTKSSYCKLQIINYIPLIPEKNKLFPDILIIPFHSNITIDEIYNYILKNRKTKQELWEIYKKYSFFYSLYPYDNNIISYFDITISYIPIPLPISDLKITYKSRQFEKIYLLIIRNTTEYFFSFITDKLLEEFPKEFYSLLTK